MAIAKGDAGRADRNGARLMWGVEILTGATLYTLALALPFMVIVAAGVTYGAWTTIADEIAYWPTWRIICSVPRWER